MRGTKHLHTNNTQLTRNSTFIFFTRRNDIVSKTYAFFSNFHAAPERSFSEFLFWVDKHLKNKKKLERNKLEIPTKWIGKFVADPSLVARQFSLFLIELFGYTTAATSSSYFRLFFFLFFSSTTYGNFGNVIARCERICKQLRCEHTFSLVLSNSARRLTHPFAQFSYVILAMHQPSKWATDCERDIHRFRREREG